MPNYKDVIPTKREMNELNPTSFPAYHLKAVVRLPNK